MSKHEDLYTASENAIHALHGDTSVSKDETLASLNGLKDSIEMLIECVEGDIAAEGSEQ